MLNLRFEVVEVRKTEEYVELLLNRQVSAIVQEYPVPESEEEEMVYSMMKAFERFFRFPFPQKQQFSMVLRLSMDEYSRLGRPTVGDLLDLTLRRAEEVTE